MTCSLLSIKLRAIILKLHNHSSIILVRTLDLGSVTSRESRSSEVFATFDRKLTYIKSIISIYYKFPVIECINLRTKFYGIVFIGQFYFLVKVFLVKRFLKIY